MEDFNSMEWSAKIMRNVIQKVPIPLCGVMLGVAALGNLLKSYSESIRYVCGGIAGILLVLVLLKLILFPGEIKEDLKNPVMASVSGTFSMSLMLLSVYAKPWIGTAAYGIWLSAIGLHIILILFFTAKFIIKLRLSEVFASYYIVYVGIAAAAVTAPAYGKPVIGKSAFWFGLGSLLVLSVLITFRYIRYKEIPKPFKPLICIYAAPVNLCIAGYLQSMTTKNNGFLLGMLAVASLLYIFALVKAIAYLQLPFYPSYASFTFPFVISATAAKETMIYFMDRGCPIPALPYVALAETVIAAVLVTYTLVRFLLFLFMRQN